MFVFVNEFKHITNQGEETAEINLFSPISNSQNFINELNYLDSLGLKEINININSLGGSVFEGFGIFTAIQNAKTEINTINAGVAASMAGIILVSGSKRKMVDFGQLMVHNPSFSGKKAENKSQKDLLSKIKNSLLKMITNKTGIENGLLSEMMNKETWLNSKEALEAGFIDEIISTKRNLKNEQPEEIYNLVVNNFKPKKQKMELVTNYLKLEKDAKEEEVLNAVKTIENLATETESNLVDVKNELETANETISNQKTELETAKNEIAELKKSIALTNVENAIKEGKIKEENKEQMLEAAINTPEAFNTILNSIEVKDIRLNDLIINTSNIENKNEGKSLRQLEKESPEFVQDIIKNDWAKYEKLYLNEYGVKPRK